MELYFFCMIIKIGKGVRQGCILSPCLFNLYAKYIMRNARLEEAQAGIKIAGRTINNLRYADDTTLMAESEEELKSLLMRVKEESEKAGLKLNIQKTKIMASSPITSWQIDGGKVETVTHFILGGSKITLNSDFNHDIKMLAPWKKSYDKQCIQKQRHHFADKILYILSYVFSSSHGCESWTIKRVKCQRTAAFEPWYWRRLLRVPWTARRSN